MLTAEEFNDFLDKNEIDIPHAHFQDCVLTKLLEAIAWQNKRATELEIRIGELENG